MNTIKKQNARRLSDLLHLAIYIAILLLFASYESGRKSAPQQQVSVLSGPDHPLHPGVSPRTNVTSWK